FFQQMLPYHGLMIISKKLVETLFLSLKKFIYFIDKNHSNDTYSDDSSDSEESSEDKTNVENTSEDNYYPFDCQVEGCVARYRYYANLLRHYTTGKHKMKLEKHSLIDKSKIPFHQSLTTNHLRSTPLLSITVVSPVNSSMIPPLTQNWASQK